LVPVLSGETQPRKPLFDVGCCSFAQNVHESQVVLGIILTLLGGACVPVNC
jgi:hypothetical protein